MFQPVGLGMPLNHLIHFGQTKFQLRHSIGQLFSTFCFANQSSSMAISCVGGLKVWTYTKGIPPGCLHLLEWPILHQLCRWFSNLLLVFRLENEGILFSLSFLSKLYCIIGGGQLFLYLGLLEDTMLRKLGQVLLNWLPKQVDRHKFSLLMDLSRQLTHFHTALWLQFQELLCNFPVLFQWL